jgi:hypothetical protein
MGYQSVLCVDFVINETKPLSIPIHRNLTVVAYTSEAYSGSC